MRNLDTVALLHQLHALDLESAELCLELLTKDLVLLGQKVCLIH